MVAICPTCCETLELEKTSTLPLVCPRCRSQFLPADATVYRRGGTFPAATSVLAGAGAPGVDFDLSVPQEIPGYEIQGIVARGGMGVVLQARHVTLRRQVAIKVPLPQRMRSSADRVRFLREARAAAGLRHPNICPIYEVGECSTGPFIAMGFIPGQTLRDWEKAAHPTPRQTAEIVATIARAIHYAHEHGVVHRDIKPANILIDDESGAPVLTDFGLAKQLDDPGVQVTQTGQLMGTPAYMSPEQAAGHLDRIGPATDVYALGVVLFELLCGRPPFLGTVGEIVRQVQTREAPSPRKFSPQLHRDLATICVKALAGDIELRYATAAELADDLDRFAAGEPIRARPVGWMRRVVKRIRRYPAAAATILAIMLLAAATVSYFALRTSRSAEVARLVQDFETALDRKDWSPEHLASVESLVDRLGRISPDQADAARQRLHQRFAEVLQQRLRAPVLQPRDIREIQRGLDLLAQRRADLAGPLREHLSQRLRKWQPLFDLQAPLRDHTVFGEKVVHSTGDVLFHSAAPEKTKPAPRVPTRVASLGNVRLQVTFDPSWRSAEQVGLVLNAHDGRGWSFLVRAAQRRGPNTATAPSAATLGESGGVVRLSILRDSTLLRERLVYADALPPGPLRLSVERTGNHMTFQAHTLQPVVFEDIFSTVARKEGVFAVCWPKPVGVRRLVAHRQAMAAAPSALERGDALHAAGDFTAALEEYRRQEITAAKPSIAHEARYKQAVCLIALKREEDAAGILQSLLDPSGSRLAMLAGCQLWRLRLRQKRLEDADVLLTQMSTAYDFKQLAPMVPQGLLREIWQSYERKASPVSLVLNKAQDVRFLERTLIVEELLRGRPKLWTPWRLHLVQLSANQMEPATKTLRDLMRRYRPSWTRPVDPDPMTLISPNRDRIWDAELAVSNRAVAASAYLSRLRGARGEAIDLVQKWLCEKPGTYRPHRLPLLISLAQCHLANGQPAAGEEAIEDYFRLVPRRERPVHGFWTHACLVRGYLRWDRGDKAGAVAAWRLGLAKPGEIAGGMDVLHVGILRSLSDELSTADFQNLLSPLTNGLPPDQHRKMRTFLQLLDYKFLARVQKTSWRSDEGRRLARRMAYGQIAMHEMPRDITSLMIVGFVREGAFAGTLAGEKHALVRKAAEQYVRELREERIGLKQFVSIMMAWSGMPLGMSWRPVAQTLSQPLRAATAYVLGHRSRRLKKPKQAEAFFREAVQYAGTDAMLVRLAKAELADENKP